MTSVFVRLGRLRESNSDRRYRQIACSLFVIGAATGSLNAANQFFAGDGSALSASKWASTSAGPFTSAFTANNVANFATVDGTGTGATLTFGGFNATENFTLTTAGGTIGNVSNGVITIDVASTRLSTLEARRVSRRLRLRVTERTAMEWSPLLGTPTAAGLL